MICEVARNRGDGADIHLLNAYSVALAEQNVDYRKCLLTATTNFPDGKPLSLFTRWTSSPLKQVRGPRLFENVMDEGRGRGVRHFLLGSTPETLEKLKNALEHRYPGVQIVGVMSPPFRELTAAEIVDQDAKIADTKPDIVWVGLGTPKQDFEAQRLARSGRFMAVAVGAAFDFSAGTKREAPNWMSAVGVEWLFRFASEPRRLWRRYLIGNVVFIYSVLRRIR
jgi:N-acetylglucosaminyldiphosphoundecaprenol N-acetyl-beta-D-mannosaminyltransferase